MKSSALNFDIVLREEPEGGFTVWVPDLPGCITYGKDLKDAKEMAVDAIQCYLGSLRKHKKLFKREESFVTSVQVPMSNYA